MSQAHQNKLYGVKNIVRATKAGVPAGWLEGDARHAFELNAARLPEIVDMGFSATRHEDWPAVVTAHRNSHIAHVWSASLGSLVPKTLQVPVLQNKTGSGAQGAKAGERAKMLS